MMSLEPDRKELLEVFSLRVGQENKIGWGPLLRKRFDYFTPDEWYEALVNKLVSPKTSWLDVGCGHRLFPSNLRLSQKLTERCQCLVGLDPDNTILENPYVHEKVQSSITEYRPERNFDLITLRMVAEHITDPVETVESLRRLTKPGGRVVIYTVFKWSPVSVIARVLPFTIHHPIKRFFWSTQTKDTFPVAYKMNTRTHLKRLFNGAKFEEVYFKYLDDCRTLSRFYPGAYCELLGRHWLKSLNLHYPELSIIGIYERVT